VDADMYVRQNTDSIFCAPVDPAKHIIAVTPRSSFDAKAGFNAGMFVYNPTNAQFDNIMAKFLALSQVGPGRYQLTPHDASNALIQCHSTPSKECSSVGA